MESRRHIRTFLAGETRLTRACFAFATVSAALVVLSWFPHGFYVYFVIYPMHLGVMALMFVLFAVLARRNLSAFSGKSLCVVETSLPVLYWPCLGVSLLYCLVVFIGYAMTSPQGVSLGPSIDFRIAASFYLFLSLASFGFAHWSGRRKRADPAA